MGQQCCGNVQTNDKNTTIESGGDSNNKKTDLDSSKNMLEAVNSADISMIKLLNERRSVLLSKDSYQDFLQLNPDITRKIIDGSQEEALIKMLSKEEITELKNIAKEVNNKQTNRSDSKENRLSLINVEEDDNSNNNNKQQGVVLPQKLGSGSQLNNSLVNEKKEEAKPEKKPKAVVEVAKEEKQSNEESKEDVVNGDLKKKKKKPENKKIVGFDVNDIEQAMKGEGKRAVKGGTEYDQQSRASIKSTASVKGVLKKYDTSSCYAGDTESVKKKKKRVKFAEPYGKAAKKKSKRH